MPTGSLPTQLTSVIGREQEVADLARLLVTARLVTVTGAGGAGKTRLAVEAARGCEFFDEARLTDLGAINEPALIPSAVATALEVFEVAGEPPLETIVRSLRSRPALLVLDNIEHLIVPCAVVVERMLQSCPSLTVPATSREPLNLNGEHVQRLLPLTPPEAAALFWDRAVAAAPYARMLSLRELALQLDQRLELFHSRAPTGASRHQTLQALVDWSYELLPPEEQQLYARLSVLAGGCTRDTIAGAGLQQRV